MIKASATVTITCYRDTNSITRYYKLQSSTASVPSKPNTNPPPSEWNDSEPSYTSGSTNTLYFCDLSVFSDGTFSYSTVSKSSSYEAAKEAYNKAQNAQSTADTAVNHVNQIEIGGRNLIPSSEWICDVTTTDYAWNKNTQKVYIEVGETYTLSCYYNGTRVTDQSHGCAYIYAYDSNDTKIIDGDYMTTSNGISTRTVTEENISYVTVSFGVKNCVAGDVYAVKLEKGNKATDWTPAPEDIDKDIGTAQNAADSGIDRIAKLEAYVKILDEAIANIVRKNGDSSVMIQDENETTWYFDVGNLEKDTQANASAIENLEDQSTKNKTELDKLKELVEDHEERFTISVFEGEPCAILHEKTDSDRVQILTNTRRIFARKIEVINSETGETETQYTDLIVTDYETTRSIKAEFDESAKIGQWVWKQRSNGNIGLMWNGVDE